MSNSNNFDKCAFVCKHKAMIKINSQIRDMLNAAEHPVLAEKDYVECMVLASLFCDNGIASGFALTGGASLTKAYHISPRQSCDIDLAYIGNSGLRIQKSDTRSQMKKFKSSFRKMVFGTFLNKVNYLINPDNKYEILTDMQYQGQMSPTLHLIYPSCVTDDFGHTAIEVIPRKYDVAAISWRRVTSYAIRTVSANVPTVDYEQTFWDKVYALHTFATSSRVNFHPMMSRHYYDVALMASHIDKIKTRHMLDNIIAHQMRFANYDVAPVMAPCDIVLIPDVNMQHLLANDFLMLRRSQLALPLRWTSIMNVLKKLEYELGTIKR